MATPTSIWQNMFPPKTTWDVDQIPDLSGKVMLITGGYTGIGKETVPHLLKKNAKVYIAGRSKAKAQPAIAELKMATGKEPIFITLDLADLPSVKAGVAEFQSQESRLDVLFNSAGVMFTPIEMVNKQGMDIQIATNLLGHFYLTKLLLPTLLATAKISPDGKARVINTSSMGHNFCKDIDINTFMDGPARVQRGSKQMYFQSKFGNVVFANELARRYGSKGLISVSLHPGNIKTELTRHGSAIERAVISTMLYPVPLGALTQLYAGTTPDVEKLSGPGRHLVPWARMGGASEATNDPKLWTLIWDWCEEQVKNV